MLTDDTNHDDRKDEGLEVTTQCSPVGQQVVCNLHGLSSIAFQTRIDKMSYNRMFWNHRFVYNERGQAQQTKDQRDEYSWGAPRELDTAPGEGDDDRCCRGNNEEITTVNGRVVRAQSINR